MLNVVGHELRTPVTTMLGLVEELTRVRDEPTRQALIDAVARNARRLDRLVEDLLLASEVETVVPIGRPRPVDLVDAVHAAWARAGDGRLQLSVGGAATATARPAVVTRALEALLDNAVVHGEPPVDVHAFEDGDAAVVEVTTGGGTVSASDLVLACEPFFRGERAVTTTPGLGLGLAVARTLARFDGGDISVRAGDAGGFVARLELPRAA